MLQVREINRKSFCIIFIQHLINIILSTKNYTTLLQVTLKFYTEFVLYIQYSFVFYLSFHLI